MNSTDNICSSIPEIQCAVSSGQVPADRSGISAVDWGAPDGVELPVIARIPDLDAPRPIRKHRHSSHSRPVQPVSVSGRLLSAGLSLNILVGLGLLLVVGAIFGGVQWKSGNVQQARQADQSASSSDTAPAWMPLAGQPKASPQLPPQSPGDRNSNVQASAPLSASAERFAGGETANRSSDATAVRLDNNIVPSNIITPTTGGNAGLAVSAGPRMREMPAATQAAVERPGSLAVAPRSAENFAGAAVGGPSDAWPAIADERAGCSPWPNPAHPIFASADLRNSVAAPPGAETMPPRAGAAPAVNDRPAVIGNPMPAAPVNPPGLRPVEQYDYRSTAAAEAGQYQSFTSDRRNAAAGAAAPSPAPRGREQPTYESEQGRTQLDGVINTPIDGNTYDRSRPSIH